MIQLYHKYRKHSIWIISSTFFFFCLKQAQPFFNHLVNNYKLVRLSVPHQLYAVVYTCGDLMWSSIHVLLSDTNFVYGRKLLCMIWETYSEF
jgi:hypothetical protein